MSFLSVTDFAGAGLGAPPHGHHGHHGHHGGGGGWGRGWAPTYGPGYYDPYWNASPYLVVLDGNDEDDEDAKKKKRKKRLADRLGTAWNW